MPPKVRVEIGCHQQSTRKLTKLNHCKAKCNTTNIKKMKKKIKVKLR